VPATVDVVAERETKESSQLQVRAETISSHNSGEHRKHLLPASQAVWRQGIISSFAEWDTAKVPKDVLDVWVVLKGTAATSVPVQDRVDECALAVLRFLDVTTGKPTPSRMKKKPQTQK
jgi:hypothetical protein